jgi:hypothetical protein
MGILDRLFGQKSSRPQTRSAPSPTTSDEQALARYRYLLRTAPPEAIEQAHAEAFAQLTPQQRAQALKELSQELPASERAPTPNQADAQALARMATRAEMRQPGTLERVFGGRGIGMGMGGMFAGSLLSSIAGTFIGTAIAHQFLSGFHDAPEAQGEPLESAHADASDHGADGDFDSAGDDLGGDFGDFGDV